MLAAAAATAPRWSSPTTAASDGTMIATTAFASDYDTVLYARADCLDDTTELACNDDVGELYQSYIEFDVTAGDELLHLRRRLR